MGPSSATHISELPFELFHVISSHFPLAYRPSTLLSLALTCNRLYEVVVPYLLYNAVRVQGEEQASRTLNMLTAKAAPLSEEDIQKKRNSSPSHCIHHLCINTSITIPILTSDHSINAVRMPLGIPTTTRGTTPEGRRQGLINSSLPQPRHNTRRTTTRLD